MATGFSTADGTQPVKLPMTDTLVVSNYAGVNLWGYGPRPIKFFILRNDDEHAMWQERLANHRAQRAKCRIARRAGDGDLLRLAGAPFRDAELFP